jgi:hypothetical protein
LYHLNIHDTTDEVAAGVTREDVRRIVKHLGYALKMEMFLQ